MKTKATNKKTQKKKIVLTTLAVGAAGILGYFGWQYYKKKKKDKDGTEPDISFNRKTQTDTIPVPIRIDTPVYRPVIKPKPKPKPQVIYQNPYTDDEPVTKNEFPLRRGSKGEKVRSLQEALIAKHGKQVLPRYGADGDFGPEMTAALKKLKLPSVIEQSTYNVLMHGHQGGNSNTGTGNSLAKQLLAAANKKDFNLTVQLLKRLKSKDDYKTVGDEFKNYRIDGGVRQTLVNGLLNTFKTVNQKQAIRFEFLRMGLQFDGKKWSLDGFDGVSIVTIEPTTVWVNSNESIAVPAKMVLGNEITKRLDYTLFENNGKHFLVQTKSIKQL